jgi:hypothetical protein
MGRISKADKEWCWEKAKEIAGENPNLWREDEFGNQIYKPSYGNGRRARLVGRASTRRRQGRLRPSS